MRVLITTPVFPPDLGGPATYVPSVARFLHERGHDVRVLAFCSDPSPQGYPFSIEAISGGSLPGRYLRAAKKVFTAAKDVDVVYVNEHLAFLHVLAARLRRKPVVIRIMVDGSWEIAHRKGWCDGDGIVAYQGKRYGLRVALTRALQRRWWSWCTHIISCSEFLRQILIQTYKVPSKKVQRIFNAYHGPRVESIQENQEQARAALGLDQERRYALTICRLMGWKRVDGIIDALVGLPEDVDLLVAGEGDMQEGWAAHASSLGLGKRVHFVGNVPHAQIPLYIRAANVFVLNSEYEGLSHTLLEVLYLGTPIIASGVCGNPEVVEDGVNGLLVDPQDPMTLHHALKRLLENPALGERFVANGLKRKADFDREGTFTQVEAVLVGAAGHLQGVNG